MGSFAAVLVVLAAFSGRPDPRETIARAAELYARQQYEQALAALDALAGHVGERLRPAWLFDRAATLYKLGRVDDAREAWNQAAALADPRLEAACRYNLGNCDYQQALKAAGDPQQAAAALEQLQRAIANYRDAIRLDPSLDDARANLELATKLREQLRRQMQQQPNPQSSRKNASQQNDSRQQKPSEGNKSSQSQNQAGSSQSNPSKSDANRPNPSDRRDASDLKQQSGQKVPNKDTQQPQPEAAPATQPKPSAGQAAQPSARLTREQAERLLQLIRDLERQRREMLRRMQAARQKPVDRDW